jgi:hypothetical protein
VPLVDVGDVFLLDVGAVAQQQAAQVVGGVRGVDAPPEALFPQLRQQPGVVDVGVREQDGVDGGGVEAEVAVAFARLGAAALKQTAIEQQPRAVREVEQVFGPGDGAGGTPERKFHTDDSRREEGDDAPEGRELNRQKLATGR